MALILTFSHERTLAIFAAAGIWTLLVWGQRITLLTGSEIQDLGSWVRITGSVAFGLALLLLAGLMWGSGSPTQWLTPVSWGFLACTLLVWLPSVLGVMPGDGSLAFKAVHLALAVVSTGFASLSVWVATR